MADKMSRYCSPGSAAFRYATAGGTDSASGGSGGSGMECMQLRSPPGPFHYLISEQAKSFVALQELQNEVGALLEFRDLVIETFPNLRSKMSPSVGSGGACAAARGGSRDWEPGVRVRRKLAAPADAADAADTAARKPQQSVQDSGFSTETSCKDAHSSPGPAGAAPAATAAHPSPAAAAAAPLEDELGALLDVIQRKGSRLRDDVELLRGELEPASRSPDSSTGGGAEERFARALAGGCPECGDARRLRRERDALLARSAELAAAARAPPDPATPCAPAPPPATPLGRLDRVLSTPTRPLRVQTPDSKKFAAILHESNPVELQRHLLTSTVHTQVLLERLQRITNHRALLLDRLERTRDENDDLKFQLEEKSIELEGTKAKMRQLEGGATLVRGARDREHSSMRDMEPLPIPDEPAPDIGETPKRGRRSRIPLPGHKHPAAKPPAGREPASYRSRSGDSPGRASSHSWRASLASGRGPASRLRAPRDLRAPAPPPPPTAATTPLAAKKVSSVPVRRAASAADAKVRSKSIWNMLFNFKETS